MSNNTKVTVTLTYGDSHPYQRDDTGNALFDSLPADAVVYVDRFTGIGEWEGETEHSGVIVASVNSDDIPALQATASHIAEAYGQEAIGFNVSQTPQLAMPDGMQTL